MKDKHIRIPINKFAVVIALVGILYPIYSLCTYGHRIVNASGPYAESILLASIMLFFAVGNDYYFTNEGIRCRYYGILYRKIPWTEIREALLVNEWKDITQIRHEPILLISIKPCLEYREVLGSIKSHRWHNLLHSHLIRVPEDLEETVAEYLRENLTEAQFNDKRVAKLKSDTGGSFWK